MAIKDKGSLNSGRTREELGKNSGRIGKNREESGRIGKNREEFGKNREVSGNKPRELIELENREKPEKKPKEHLPRSQKGRKTRDYILGSIPPNSKKLEKYDVF